MKCSLCILFIYLIFLKTSLVFLILFFSSISLHWSLRKAFLSFLVILWNSAFRWVYLSFSPLPLAFLLFSANYGASSDNHFAFLHFFFLRMVLITASYTMSWTCIHRSSGTLSVRSNPLNLQLGVDFINPIPVSPHIEKHWNPSWWWVLLVTLKSITRLVEIFWKNMYLIACILPSPKSHILTSPPCLFGSVSQSYLRWCLLGCSPHFAPDILFCNLTCNSHIVLFFF